MIKNRAVTPRGFSSSVFFLVTILQIKTHEQNTYLTDSNNKEYTDFMTSVLVTRDETKALLVLLGEYLVANKGNRS